MAKDMDFSARRQPIQNIKPTPSITPPSPAPTRTPSNVGRRDLSTYMIWVVIILILAVGLFAAWEYFSPNAVGQKTNSPAISSDQPAPTTNNNSLVATKNSLPSVQVYDSGAGQDAVTKVITNLKALGYSAESLDKSQFNYDKTYIWYQVGLQAEAVKIQSTMPERVIELKETKIAGTFDILVLLGTK